MSLHRGGLYSWRLSVTLISYRQVNLENMAYAHGKKMICSAGPNVELLLIRYIDFVAVLIALAV